MSRKRTADEVEQLRKEVAEAVRRLPMGAEFAARDVARMCGKHCSTISAATHLRETDGVEVLGKGATRVYRRIK